MDFVVANYLSIACIFIIVAWAFKSITVPAVLVATIELAIFLNQGFSYFSGASTPFIAPTIISCVQLGATVDYAILMTSRFQEELQSGKNRKEAIRIAADSADASIITSALGDVLRTPWVCLSCPRSTSSAPSASCWPGVL
ncbi:MAG: MMPL family transporter [Dysosmobacter sp.]